MSNNVSKLPSTEQSPEQGLSMIERLLASNPNINPDNLEKMIDLQCRVMDRNAEQAFAASMSAAQEEMAELKIIKDAENKQTSSKYAKLGNIIRAISPVYTRHGLSLSFGTEPAQVDNTIRIVCDVSHSLGFSKRYTIDMPLDNAGIQGKVNKTGPHAYGSSVSYARRYLTTMIFNLSVLDEDTDAAGPQLISLKQATQLADILSDFNEAFCKDWNVSSVRELWAENFEEALKYAEGIRRMPLCDAERSELLGLIEKAGMTQEQFEQYIDRPLDELKRGHLPNATAYLNNQIK